MTEAFTDETAPDSTPVRTHTIVVGNEKGGSGKSTTCMHIIAALLKGGFSVGSIDLDARQATLTRYIENRRAFMERKGIDLPMPEHAPVLPSSANDRTEARADEQEQLEHCIAEMSGIHDYIVIDTPGSDSHLGRLGHSYADTLVTPLNDSFVDLDVLAKVEPETFKVLGPSKYAEMVFEQKKAKALRGRSNRTFDWIVMRNRMGQLESKNQQAVEAALQALSGRIGFRMAPGFHERVIFRELFLDGLTLLDIRDPKTEVRINMSHVAARQEVRNLIQAMGLPVSI